MSFPTYMHIELTSRCNKECWMCGRRKMDLQDLGDMDICMLSDIAAQVRAGTVVKLFNNGEPLLYPYLTQALALFRHCITQLNTNAKLLMEKADELIGRLDILTVSVIQDDPEAKEQQKIVTKFEAYKGDERPRMVYRILGKRDPYWWKTRKGIVVTRKLHSPYMSRDYDKPPPIPEDGICRDLMTHLAIDRNGLISPCVRFDPKGIHRVGSVLESPIELIWRSERRMSMIRHHVKGERDKVPLCSECDYWGCPTGG